MAGWGSPIAELTVAGAPTLAKADLGELYNELLIHGWGFTHAEVSAMNVMLRLSTNNGGAYATTGYVNTGIASAVSGIWLRSSLTNAQALGFCVHLINVNKANLKTLASVIEGVEGSASSPISGVARYDTARVDNAIRVENSAGANFTGGNMFVWGRN